MMPNKSTTSKFLILLAVCVIVWFGWRQYSNWYPPRNIPDSIHEAFRNADLRFLSLSPKHPPDNPDAELFHGFEILGSMIVEDRSTRIRMIDTMDRAVGKNEITMARCWWPRHGIRCHYKGDQIDLIVCFECAPMVIYVNGKSVYSTEVGDSPKKLYDQILQSENLPINAPPW